LQIFSDSGQLNFSRNVWLDGYTLVRIFFTDDF
jgi:hypothetical protein